MTNHRFDLVVVGDCGVDVYAEVPRLPSHDEKVPARFIGFHGGGVAANFACAAQRLGATTALLATVGDDPFASIAVESVAAFGVDVSGIHRMSGETTSFCFVALDASGEKALTIVRTPTFFPRLVDIDLGILQDAKAVHIAPFDVAAATEIARAARTCGAKVTLDLEPGMLEGRPESMYGLIEHANLAMPNLLFLEALLPGVGLRDAAHRLLDVGPDAVVVTRGAAGSFVVDAHGEAHVESIPAKVVDTTGAGDCFNAAMVTAWLAGENLASAARLASAAASFSIAGVGARGRLPTLADARLMLQGESAGDSEDV